MPEESLKNKTAKGLFWGGIGSGFQQVIQLICGIFMLTILNPEDYGIVGVLYIFTAIAQVIQDSGFTAALINKKQVDSDDYNAVFWFSVLVSFGMYLILFFAAPIIAEFYNQPELVLISRVFFLSFLIGGIGVAQHAYIMKELLVKTKAKIDIWALLISGICGILFAFLGCAYWAIIIQNLLYFTVSIVIRWFSCPWKPSLRIHFHPLKGMFSFSVKLFLTSLFNRIVENIFSVLLGKFYTKEQVGYYIQGNKWSSMGGAFITNMINGVAQPVLTRISEDKGRQQNAFRKMLRFGAFVSFPLLLGLGFVAEEFFLIIGGGDKWLLAVPYLQLFCIWRAFYYIWSLYTNLLIARGKSDIYMLGMVIVGILQLLVLYVMFPYGIFPMIIAYISVFFAGLLFWQYFANRLIGLRLWNVIKDISPYLIVTLGSILMAWFAVSGIENLILRFALKILVTAVLYITIMWFSNSVIVRESFDYLRALANKRNKKE